MEALERQGKTLAVAAILLIVFWSQCKGVEGHRNSTKMSYLCPPQFIRLGHSCYFFSENKATWQNALFTCKDKESNLSIPARWEDKNLRKYLNQQNIDKASRWIGGIYDSSSRAWKWGGELREMRYHSFSKMKKLSHEELQWHCIAMVPELYYKWAPRSCIEANQFICQTKIRKVPKTKVKEYRNRWKKMGKLNEITAPSVSSEFSSKINDVTQNPFLKSYDLGPSQLRLTQGDDPGAGRHHGRPKPRKRSRPYHGVARKLTVPFRGYRWNRLDPEGSFKYNAELLRSGRTGLRPQQVNAQLARLRHLRDRQLRRRDRGDWLVNEPAPILAKTHARTYTVDNNISALHPKTIVEEFDMMEPPPQVIPRPVRRALFQVPT